MLRFTKYLYFLQNLIWFCPIQKSKNLSNSISTTNMCYLSKLRQKISANKGINN